MLKFGLKFKFRCPSSNSLLIAFFALALRPTSQRMGGRVSGVVLRAITGLTGDRAGAICHRHAPEPSLPRLLTVDARGRGSHLLVCTTRFLLVCLPSSAVDGLLPLPPPTPAVLRPSWPAGRARVHSVDGRGFAPITQGKARISLGIWREEGEKADTILLGRAARVSAPPLLREGEEGVVFALIRTLLSKASTST